jgi:GNAT superfamily N-acetyltransferase
VGHLKKWGNSKDKNIDKYVEVIHKGFGNKGEPQKGLTEADFPEKPHANPKLAVFVIAPNGDYAAHCGTWYNPDTEICYVEPVVTIPEFRKYGLGKAIVYESINRCIEMGAKKAIVISDQQFYYRIGFEKYSICHLWEKKV